MQPHGGAPRYAHQAAQRPTACRQFVRILEALCHQHHILLALALQKRRKPQRRKHPFQDAGGFFRADQQFTLIGYAKLPLKRDLVFFRDRQHDPYRVAQFIPQGRFGLLQVSNRE